MNPTMSSRMKMLSTASPIALCCAFSQSMITRVHRSISRCAPFGSSTMSIMNSVVPRTKPAMHRSEEHTSELQSLRHLVCRLLLEKKKKTNQQRSSSRKREQEGQDSGHRERE